MDLGVARCSRGMMGNMMYKENLIFIHVICPRDFDVFPVRVAGNNPVIFHFSKLEMQHGNDFGWRQIVL